MPGTGLILLAAGGSSRMGHPKQLLSFRGKPLGRHAVEVALQSVCRPVFVVLGANADAIRTTLASIPIVIIENKQWELGIGTSIGAGIRAAQEYGCDGAILALADQPYLKWSTFDELTNVATSSEKQIIPSQYSETLGAPAYFSTRYFGQLLALRPQEGCKSVILSNLEECFPIACPEAADDIDTPADWDRLCGS